MPSLLVEYDRGKLRKRTLDRNLRSLAWSGSDELILVGNRGAVLRSGSDGFQPIESGTQQNLRDIAVNAADDSMIAVGNAGTLIMLDGERRAHLAFPSSENMRRAAWDDHGEACLVVGNRGTALRYSDGTLHSIEDGRANLRGISWRPRSKTALITSNCFAEEFIPSPNLFGYDDARDHLSSLHEGRVDLIGVAWHPSGQNALVVGYDIVWHQGFIGVFDGEKLSAVQFENKRVYPVSVGWNPSGDLAAIVTATTEVGVASGVIYLWDGVSLNQVYKDSQFFFSKVTWNRKGGGFAALASTETRTFSC